MLTVLLEKRSAVEGPAVDPRRLQTLVEAPPYPLSSRAKPRDLQFCRPVLEMFFEEAVWALRPVGPTAKRQPSPARAGASISQHCPSAVGAAHFYLNLHQYSVEKHSQDGPAELQIPRLRSG